jgi:hypothetical protein
MEPLEIWLRNYKAKSSYNPPVVCMNRYPQEEAEKLERAVNFKDLEDNIEIDFRKLDDYVPIGNPPVSFFSKDNFVVNISSTFRDKGGMFLDYTKTIEIYNINEHKESQRELTDLLKSKGFKRTKTAKS